MLYLCRGNNVQKIIYTFIISFIEKMINIEIIEEKINENNKISATFCIPNYILEFLL